MFKLTVSFSILLSFVCMLLAYAAFTPAIGVSLMMLIFAGVIGYKRYLQSSLVLLFINTFAVIGSPGLNSSNIESLLFLFILFSISFGGVLMGIRK
ncbi:DUF6419 family natural product biosynthesis protein [uncultured Shewanella sp.]|uniref:DUF6419 family natural product biosynthesis protein n=1 Tax=uncultured Shewanella sp. TaxID=173975 RepID=UPI002601DA81|nr:DUF6419 family natural product biosynthesis protein [uncultured Shewanella sp.]